VGKFKNTFVEFDVSLVIRTLLAKKALTSLDKVVSPVGKGHKVAES
jgi:hypothetical protein